MFAPCRGLRAQRTTAGRIDAVIAEFGAGLDEIQKIRMYNAISEVIALENDDAVEWAKCEAVLEGF
jgi:hypothetical protein